MSRVLHLSDTHFGTEQPLVVDALDRCIGALAPDVIVHSGDVTQRARASEFRAARAWMNRHPTPRWLVVPGNHDVPLWSVVERCVRPYARFERGLGQARETELNLGDLLVLGVDTTRPWRHKHGDVSRSQVARVAARLEAATPKQLRVVVTHQPLHVITERDRRNRVRGAEHAVAAWTAAGADLLLGGHIHLPYVRALHEARPLSRRVWTVQAGTAISWRTRGRHPNSFFVVNHAFRAGCVVERWDFDDVSLRFAAAERTELELDA